MDIKLRHENSSRALIINGNGNVTNNVVREVIKEITVNNVRNLWYTGGSEETKIKPLKTLIEMKSCQH